TGSFAKKHSANAPKESLITMLIDSRVYLLRINLHGIHNNVAPSVKIPFSKSSSQVEVDIRDIFHCDGLLLCTTKDNRLVVWNPCSGETKWIKPRNPTSMLSVTTTNPPASNTKS
ncbi:Quinoprotein alcohol dehydrogenase-like superfamily, partial [Arabidopsis suecica]